MNKNLFNSILVKKPKRNHFDLTHDVKLSLDFGNLVPIMTMECVPGDKFNISAESLLRFAPLTSPVMHRMDVTMHYFFVPNRIVWPDWEKFIINEPGIAAPYIGVDQASYQQYKLLDYMGIPPLTAAGGTIQVNALPFAAYQAIYNEYYRDQNLIPEIDYTLVNGDNSQGAGSERWVTMRKRAWEHDYFTAALPWAQKGNPVQIPLAGFNDVPVKVNLTGGASPTQSWTANVQPSGTALTIAQRGLTPDDNIASGELYADTSALEGTSTTINDLRRAFRLQEWLEKNARAGTRYIENILMHFGVKSPDARLQRPEYITGTKSPVVISEILNTTGENGGLPQGNMAGHGISVTAGKNGSYFCNEHGYIIGIMSVMPKPAYQQGIAKHFLKTRDAFQYYWPDFANIGEQEVENQEIYADQINKTGVFGYVPRYAEYKYQPSRVCGDFRSTLDFWHFGRIFANAPQLNKDFVECNPGRRIFAVEDPQVDPLYCHILNKVHAVRPMPKFGTPSF